MAEPKIHWAAVARGATVLAEAGADARGGEVLKLAKKILAKKPSPGARGRPAAQSR